MASKTIEQLEAYIAELSGKEMRVQADKTAAITELEKIYDDAEAAALAEGKVKLYEVPRETWVSMTKDKDTLFFFDHIDGMYSYCVNRAGDVIHVGASTMVFMHHDIKLASPERRE
jgi:hypothetical protein